MSGRCFVCDALVDPSEFVPVNPKEPDGLKRAGIVQRFEGFDPIYYCGQHAHKVKPPRARPRRQFRLRGDERLAILRGEHPQLERSPGEPELEVGDTYELNPHVWIEIMRKGTNKRGQIQYRWKPHDQRLDRPRILRRTPPALRAEIAREDRVHPPTKAEIAQAAEDSAYAAGGARDTLIADAGEAPSKAYEQELQLRSRLRRAEQVTDEILDEAA